MDDSVRLFIGVVFSSFGLAYFIYGKKQQKLIPALTGLVLMIYPYFTPGCLSLILIGVVGIALPWVLRD